MRSTILIYADYGSASVEVLQRRLKSLYPAKTIALTDAAGIHRGDLSEDVGALFFGGGAATPYKRKLGEAGAAAVRQYVHNGGTYVGICAGAYFACDKIVFEKDVPELALEQTGLGLLKATAVGTLRKELGLLPYERTSFSASVVGVKGLMSGLAYYHGGCFFENFSADVLAEYDLSVPKAAVITARFGSGTVLAAGIHPEETADSLKEAFRPFSSDSVPALKNIKSLEKNFGPDLLKLALDKVGILSF